MLYIILTLITLFVSQTLKFIFRYFFNKKDCKNIFWVYIWATGAPSTHSAVLVANLVLLNHDIAASPIFMFSCIVSIIFMYNLVADREREKIEEKYFSKGNDVEKEIVSSGKILDISGHSLFDIICGVLLGLVIGFLFINSI